MDNMEKELWDAFYGKESKQERCSVLTEAELNKHNKGILKEGYMSDEDIHNQFSKFEVLDFSKEGEHSGYIELSFPNADEVDYDSSVITGYTIYEDGKVAFDKWFPDDVYNEVAKYVKQHHFEELDEGCGKKKKKALKEDMNSSSPKMKKFGHFNVAVVFPNEKSVGRPRYTNTYKTEVEFYDDNNHEGFGPYGQFVSSYLLDTLLGKSEYSDNDIDGRYPYGLQLHGNSPNWTVPAETMSEIIDWLKQFDNEALKEDMEYNNKWDGWLVDSSGNIEVYIKPEDRDTVFNSGLVPSYAYNQLKKVSKKDLLEFCNSFGDPLFDDDVNPSIDEIIDCTLNLLCMELERFDSYSMEDTYVGDETSLYLDEGCGKKKKKKALKESAEPVYISVDVTRHNGSVIVKSDEFGKITYLPNDFEKLEDTIKRVVNDYAAENNIAEYEVIKLYESKNMKALKEDYEEDYEEDEELTPVDVDSMDVDEFYNGYVMDNGALWDDDIDYDAMEANKNQIFHYWKQLVKGGEDEWDAVEISVRRFASNGELDEGCGEKSEELDEILKPRHNRTGRADMKKESRLIANNLRRIRKIRDAINAGVDVSWDEVAFLEDNQETIKKYFPDDIELWQWANIPEDEWSAHEQSLKESDEDMSGYEDRLNKTIKSEMKKFPKYVADAKKALDDGEEIKKILNKYNQEYNFLYNNHDKVAGYEEAVRAWDEYINHPDFRELIGKVIKARHDMFTSDREIGALMFALDALGYLDKFDGKESSLEPIVKEFKMNEGITTIDVNGKRYDIDTSMFVVDKHKGKWCVLDTKSNVRYYMDSKKEAEQKCRELNDPEEWKKWYLGKA